MALIALAKFRERPAGDCCKRRQQANGCIRPPGHEPAVCPRQPGRTPVAGFCNAGRLHLGDAAGPSWRNWLNRLVPPRWAERTVAGRDRQHRALGLSDVHQRHPGYARHGFAMNREQILGILYDLSLTIGGELDLDSLLTRTLQRLLFHTSFPAAVVLADRHDNDFGISASLEGAGRLPVDRAVRFSAQFGGRSAQGPRSGCSMIPALLGLFAGPRLSFRPASANRWGTNHPVAVASRATGNLPLTQIFQPVLNNLAGHCPLSQQRAADQCADGPTAAMPGRTGRCAGAELSVSRPSCQPVRRHSDLVWVKDMNGVYLSCNPMFCRFSGPGTISSGEPTMISSTKELADSFRANDRAATEAGRRASTSGSPSPPTAITGC